MWEMLAGALGLGTAAVGIGAGLSKGLFMATAHDVKICKCKRCDHIRWKHELKQTVADKRRIVQNRMAHDESFPAPGEIQAHWLSTAELSKWQFVGFRRVVYRVTDIRTDAKGYVLELTNHRTRGKIIALVSFERANRKYWAPVSHWER